MRRRLWRGWAAACVVGGAVILPLFIEVFAGGSPLRFLALPIRWIWMALPAAGLLAAGWLSPRLTAALVGTTVALMIVGTGVDLIGVRAMHPGWFLALEWWQRPLWPWLDLLPGFLLNQRPGYLWVAWVWTACEGALVTALLWRLGGRDRR